MVTDSWTTRSIALGLLVVVLVLLAGDATEEHADWLDQGAASAASGDWEDAFRSYGRAAERDPSDRRAQAGLSESAGALLEEPQDLSVDVAVDLVRWLDAQGRTRELADLLDASVVIVQPGPFTMGSDRGRSDEKPARVVELSGYAMDRFEVTNVQYERYVNEAGGQAPDYWQGNQAPPGTTIKPVVGVSWGDAAEYCEWVGKRLPTEAEWERSCRGAAGVTYPWGDDWDQSLANVSLVPLQDPDDAWEWLSQFGEGPAAIRTVGEPVEGATSEGICNLAGNAAEWVADWYDPNAYSRLGTRDPLGDGPPWNHVVRGGSWLFRHPDPDLLSEHSRCGFRAASHSDDDPRVGFRCAS